MLSVSARRQLDNWNNNSIRPGAVGSVGDTLTAVQLKSSLPGDYREAPWTKGKKEERYGSNVQDGDISSWDTGFTQGRVMDGFFGGERDSIFTQRGWVFQNIKPEDMSHDSIMGSLPQYAWRNQVATINNAAKTGEKFARLPGGYQPDPNAVPRGGQKPGVVAGEGKVVKDPMSGVKQWQGTRPQDYGGGYAGPAAEGAKLRREGFSLNAAINLQRARGIGL
jgi:hypothetical protein